MKGIANTVIEPEVGWGIRSSGILQEVHGGRMSPDGCWPPGEGAGPCTLVLQGLMSAGRVRLESFDGLSTKPWFSILRRMGERRV